LSGGLATQLLLIVQLCLVGQLRLVGQPCLVMRSIGMRLRQLLIVGQLRLDGSSESAAQGIITSESDRSKMAVLPETREGNVHISSESARGWSLREANV